MNLVKEQIFEVVNDLRLGCMKCDFVEGKISNQWYPTERFDDRLKDKQSSISGVVNEIMKKYDTFEKVVDECDNHYGYEVNILNGLSNNVDFFYSKDDINYWVRLIPQKGDRNIYIQVYDKE